ncbi:flavodoxin family protein [Halobacillus karajensis]|uniref:NAD(P)H-dependent FMN-containing oxidoreductase YwqN n=1 Tax=Halobacillus karajensis TaxID=195088 RepID=A0A024P9J9_9BACI|nr:flavodoxin family protein [Halobacillus karajensis]CDQ20235.1 Putative NAD(P)H-dependent FMN-containing oxidoreductase YwqN [Halobacillus karajensis]CDQ25102.1 Putative NAD(P)H-dependent FMN-containing oxidoreductase YwqN [Halobacillus karajensis]CDQ28537.1 Putative NAD(P)H-dependent FMN-containing oxidoreductase YwqN [Halobacillus karajensis]
MNVGVIYGSTRSQGNTERLTEEVIKSLPDVTKIDLKTYQFKDIIDQRHDEKGFSPVEDEYDQMIDQILDCEVLIFATPIYWYGMTSVMKRFIDRWSQTVRDKNHPNFKEKMSQKQAYIIAVGGDNPHVKGLPLVQQFMYICQFIGLNYKGYVLGEGVKPNDILNDKKALEDAQKLGEWLSSQTKS